MLSNSGSNPSATPVLRYFSNRSAFNVAEPGLPLEDFDPINPRAVINGPLSSTQNNSDFAPGNILPGLTIRNQFKGDAPGLSVLDGAVGSNYFEDPLVLSFAPGVRAVAADFFASSGGASWAGAFTASIYSGKALIGTRTFRESAGGTGFVGFTSTKDITRIVVVFQPTTDVGWAPYVDNIAFGPTPAAALASHPAIGRTTPATASPPKSTILPFVAAMAGFDSGGSHWVPTAGAGRSFQPLIAVARSGR